MSTLKEVGERQLIRNIRKVLRPAADVKGTDDDAAVLETDGDAVVCSDIVTFDRHMPEGMTYDISSEAGSASKLSYGAFIAGLAKFGDEQNEKITVIMHSAKWAEMVALMGSDGHPIFADAVKGGYA